MTSMELLCSSEPTFIEILNSGRKLDFYLPPVRGASDTVLWCTQRKTEISGFRHRFKSPPFLNPMRPPPRVDSAISPTRRGPSTRLRRRAASGAQMQGRLVVLLGPTDNLARYRVQVRRGTNASGPVSDLAPGGAVMDTPK